MIEYLKSEDHIKPESEKIIIENHIHRKIFEKIQMHPIETQCLKNLKQILCQMPPLRLPNYWQDSDYLRILAFYDYEISKAAQGLIDHLKWIFKIDLSIQPHKLLLDGALYVNGFDRGFRPVIIINLQKALEYSLQEFQSSFDFLLCYLIRNVLISHYIESIVILIDINVHPLKFLNCSLTQLQDYIKNCQRNFYGRIHKVYILHEIKSELFNSLFKTLKPEFQEKIIFLEKKNLIQLQNQIDPKQLEQKLLGNSQNLINFWPPKNPQKKIESNVVQIYIDDNQQKCNDILSKYKNECNQNNQFILQVQNEEKQIIFFESVQLVYRDSSRNVSLYYKQEF
ncbi:unnamed protein product [Paramecium sonneborni]|uniref:CRAL-TRIO domain-containing protein n=1 Tax=Paramecium sonneborni TaxID=65129 RepID=A0A8S1LDU4_9CILI|nr:unnamed protein product [Paramecium sonneborni]